ncbi:hypothetical protein PUMCH_002111 [Australozyma saopauloensis]|uniref:Uncharacterized protein n=1 Tax=Australozyma saopauloensis TaxID=291208 RepID=A0AAX4H982_9ASCO|nr:hypothetical protein PUMCH_002111 [[Candida] saopauloensis]
MSTLPGVSRSPREHAIESPSQTSPKSESSPIRDRANETAKFISSLKTYNLDRRRHSHHEHIVAPTGADSSLGSESTKQNGRSQEQYKRANSHSDLADAPRQRQNDTSETSNLNLLSSLSSAVPSSSASRLEGRLQYSEMTSEAMQLKIEREKTKQMQLKCELSRSVAEIFKHAEGHSQATELISRLFFNDTKAGLCLNQSTLHLQSVPTTSPLTMVRSNSSSDSTQQAQIVIPEPHLAPSPVRRKPTILHEGSLGSTSVEPGTRDTITNTDKNVSHGRQHQDDTKADSSVELSPMSEEQFPPPSIANSTQQSYSGSRAPSLVESVSGSAPSGPGSVIGTAALIATSSNGKTSETSEDAARETAIIRLYPASTPGPNSMYPVYYAYPNPGQEQALYYIPQEQKISPLSLTGSHKSQESRLSSGGQAELHPFSHDTPNHVQTQAQDHQRPWLHTQALQTPIRPNTQVGRGNVSAYNLGGSPPSQINGAQGWTPNSDLGKHTQQQTPQHSPQQGQHLYYMNSAPMPIQGNAYVPSHYFIPPPLQAGMVSWVPGPIPERRREEEDHYNHKKRRSLKTGISFMISTPQNPPARKYNKLQ